MEEMYEIILKEGYGLKLYSTVRNRTCLVCSTDKGVFDLKKNIYDESIIVFEGEIKKNLNANGFKEVIPFIDTNDEKMFFEYNDCRYTLEQHKNFLPASEDGSWDYVKGASTMARMHMASTMEEFVCDRINYGRLENIYEKRIAEFKRIRKRIKKLGTYSKTDMLIKDYYKYYLNRADAALDMLKQSDYASVSAKSEKKKSFCHNSFKGDNIKIDGRTGSMFVDNFGKATYDICVSDLAYYIKQIIKRDDAGPREVQQVIEVYAEEAGLDKADRMINAAMVVFPWKFMSLCNEYYNKRKAFAFDSAVQRLERCTDIIKKEEEIINML